MWLKIQSGSIRFDTDFAVGVHGNVWTDTGSGSFTDDKVYVVQTKTKVIERCLLMATDPGDLVLDPTCGSGTTAYVAEQWGRRWITIDTSRVSLALARARIMGARYSYYLLADSCEGQLKEAEITRSPSSNRPAYGDIRQGFLPYERVPHYVENHRQQRRNRRYLGQVPDCAGTVARSAEQDTWQAVAGMGNPA